MLARKVISFVALKTCYNQQITSHDSVSILIAPPPLATYLLFPPLPGLGLGQLSIQLH